MEERNLNFDEVIQRRGTDCLKYDFTAQRGMPKDVLPMWVADMDFKTTSYVEDALIERTKHGIFGYSEVQRPYFEAVAGWMKRHHNWEVKEDWLIKTPGVVCGLAMAVKAFTKIGDAVLIQQPVYYPFSEVVVDNERKIVSNDLFLGDDNRYHIDFLDFENKIQEHKVKLFLLCNPHNPSGRVFTQEELTKMGDICLKYGVLVVSDEIHNDFIFQGKHSVFATVKKDFEDISIICTSASKTFNLASMLVSNIFIPNPKLRKKFVKQLDAAGLSQLSILGLIATKAAYENGEKWYQVMRTYVKENLEYLKQYVHDNIPNVSVIDSEGTYLAWLDFRKTGMSTEELEKLIIHDAKLWLDSGKIFGQAGEGFQRINVAVPRKILMECLFRIEDSLKRKGNGSSI